MHPLRALTALALASAAVTIAACTTGSYGDPYAGRRMVTRPAVDVSAAVVGPYLAGDFIGGRNGRRAKITAAQIRPLGTGDMRAYMDTQEADLRRQTVNTGVEVIRSGDDVILRMPASIAFPSGSYAIQPQFQSILREIAQTLNSDNQTYVDVLGHTDASGSDASNQALSDSRAQAVANYLSSRGVAKARVGVKGYGETAPIATNDSEEGRAQNRCIEIRIVPLT